MLVQPATHHPGHLVNRDGVLSGRRLPILQASSDVVPWPFRSTQCTARCGDDLYRCQRLAPITSPSLSTVACDRRHGIRHSRLDRCDVISSFVISFAPRSRPHAYAMSQSDALPCPSHAPSRVPVHTLSETHRLHATPPLLHPCSALFPLHKPTARGELHQLHQLHQRSPQHLEDPKKPREFCASPRAPHVGKALQTPRIV